jgi:predicted acyl esterase
MQFIGRLQAALGVRVTVQTLHERSTPRDLARFVDGGGVGVGAEEETGTGKKKLMKGETPLPMASNDVVTVVDPESLPRGGITRVDEIFFETRDGCRLSARMWLPDGVSLDDSADDASRAPAVIEILPYGVHHGTIDTDEATWPYLAGNGIACVRVDARGSGNSRGVLDDEYSPTQQRDACDAVEWVASRSWCTGAVGLMGCSWGGFVALQVAALRGKTKQREAPSLRAVCAVCATDERASDDMHWMGGSLLGENLAWGAWLLDACAAPPVPVSDDTTLVSDKNAVLPSSDNNDADTPDDHQAQSAWESRWVDRLDALKPMHGEWASIHPSTDAGDAYWSTGSVGGAKTRDIDVPVLSVGCLNGGGYANSTPRVARALGREKVTAIMGSWTHNYPHLSRSGPAFGFLAETLAFWRRNLRPAEGERGARDDTLWLPGDDGEGGGDALDEMNDAIPGVRIHVQRPPLVGGPVVAPTRAEGYWIAEASQRDLDAAAKDGAIEASFTAEKTLRPSSTSNYFKARLTDSPSDPVGAASGRWFTFGDGDDLPGDQTPDDEKSLCFDGEPVAAETALVGTPRVRVTCVRVVEDDEGGSGVFCGGGDDDARGAAARAPPPPPGGVVVARLCAVSPDDGSSHRISYGVVNVAAAARGRSVVTPVAAAEISEPGAFTVDVECAYCAFSLPVGWKLRRVLCVVRQPPRDVSDVSRARFVSLRPGGSLPPSLLSTPP